MNRKNTRLRDGTAVVLRPLTPEDAAPMVAYLRATSGETPYMVRLPEEVNMTVEAEAALLADRLADPYLADIAAFTPGGRLMGNCTVYRLADRYKQAHRAELGISIYREYWHRGLGRLLLDNALEKARVMPGIEQVELGVMGRNARAIPLYESMGFTRFGETPNAFRMKDGSYDTEILMVRFLSE